MEINLMEEVVFIRSFGSGWASLSGDPLVTCCVLWVLALLDEKIYI